MKQLSKLNILAAVIFLTSIFVFSVSSYSTISTCQTLSFPNTYYLLNQSINSTSSTTCFNITASNVTLDCGNYNISGINNNGQTGIYSNQNYSNIENCNVSSFQYGITSLNNLNTTITNTFVYSNYTSTNAYAAFTSNSIFDNISNDTFNSSTDGLILSSNNATVTDDVFSSTTGSNYGGLLISNSSYDVISNVTSFAVVGIGIQIFNYSQNDLITNSNAYSNSSFDAAIQLGGAGNYAFNNTLTNDYFYALSTSANAACEVSNAYNNTFDNDSCVTTGSAAIYYSSSSSSPAVYNNTFENSYIYTNTTGSEGIILSGLGVTQNIFANNTIACNNSNYLIYVYSNSTNNTFYNNTLKANNLVNIATIMVGAGSYNNLFYWNTIPASTSSAFYLYPNAAPAFLNTTINGLPQGNIWYNVVNKAVNVTGTNYSGKFGYFVGNAGAGYPYNSSTSSGAISGSAVDYGPLTPYGPNVSAPSLSSLFPYNNSIINPNYLAFNWTLSDYNVAHGLCNISVDSTLLKQNVYSINNSYTYLTLPENLSTSNHTWNISCTNGFNTTSSLLNFTVDGVTGNSSSANFTNGNLTYNTSAITSLNNTIFTNYQNVILSFNSTSQNASSEFIIPYNLTNSNFNISNVSIQTGLSSGLAYASIMGVNTSNVVLGGKTLYLYNANPNYNEVCVKDAEVPYTSISSACNQANEYLVSCNGQNQSGYVCNQTGNTIEITGLKHSSVIQYVSSSSSGSSSGGSSEGSSSVAYYPNVQTYSVTFGNLSLSYLKSQQNLIINSNTSQQTLNVTLTNPNTVPITTFVSNFSYQTPSLNIIGISPQNFTIQNNSISWQVSSLMPGESQSFVYSVIVPIGFTLNPLFSLQSQQLQVLQNTTSNSTSVILPLNQSNSTSNVNISAPTIGVNATITSNSPSTTSAPAVSANQTSENSSSQNYNYLLYLAIILLILALAVLYYEKFLVKRKKYQKL